MSLTCDLPQPTHLTLTLASTVKVGTGLIECQVTLQVSMNEFIRGKIEFGTTEECICGGNVEK